jgi:asparagine synthase (glutamine-hydrolysing)
MCGILGYYNKKNQKIDFTTALSKLNHRGPDDSGIERIPVFNSVLHLGHNRLSIIDLTKAGHQPMYHKNGRYVIVFNGEIYNYKELRLQIENKYNYRFDTNTDTEVLLACWEIWGIKCLDKLNGMFAFAIYDKELLQISMFRDAFGIKPLFYQIENDFISFSSEISALLSLQNKKIKSNYNTTYEYLVNGKYDNNDETFFENTFKLLPGSFISIDLINLKILKKGKWINFIIEETNYLTYEDATLKVKDTFLNNIKLQLRSDVPIGAALSGGLDSSAVVCAMRFLEPDMPINTFTFISKGDPKNEENWADKVNTFTNSIPNKIIVDPNDLFNDLDDLINVQGEPFMSSSIYAQYRVFKYANQKGITVTLDGQGADELLAGYNGYPEYRLKTMIEKGQFNEAVIFLKNWSKGPNRSYNEGLMRLIGLYLPQSLKKFGLQIIGRQPALSCINHKLLKPHYQPNNYKRNSLYRNLSNKLNNELTQGGLQSLLRHGDRNSMRWSIESRVPFLTNDFAQLMLSFPENYLVGSNGETKKIFRNAMRGIVPDEILDRKDKIGFETPEFDWLKKSKNHVKKITENIGDYKILDAINCTKLINETLEGNKEYNNIIWRIINYVKWSNLNSIENE